MNLNFDRVRQRTQENLFRSKQKQYLSVINQLHEENRKLRNRVMQLEKRNINSSVNLRNQQTSRIHISPQIIARPVCPTPRTTNRCDIQPFSETSSKINLPINNSGSTKGLKQNTNRSQTMISVGQAPQRPKILNRQSLSETQNMEEDQERRLRKTKKSKGNQLKVNKMKVEESPIHRKSQPSSINLIELAKISQIEEIISKESIKEAKPWQIQDKEIKQKIRKISNNFIHHHQPQGNPNQPKANKPHNHERTHKNRYSYNQSPKPNQNNQKSMVKATRMITNQAYI